VIEFRLELRVLRKHRLIRGGEITQLPSQLEAGVYRLVQEALTNVARHAGVAAVTVQIYVTEAMLSLFVVDEGAGFDMEKSLVAGASAGLAGMRERADLLGEVSPSTLFLARARRFMRNSPSGGPARWKRRRRASMAPGRRQRMTYVTASGAMRPETRNVIRCETRGEILSMTNSRRRASHDHCRASG
jgi:hypothetical protein